MAVHPCRVTVSDTDGIEHSAHVSASSLFEAVALGLRAIRGSIWVGEIPEGVTRVSVSVLEVPVHHTVQMKDFHKWLTREGGSPNERAVRARVREILR